MPPPQKKKKKAPPTVSQGQVLSRAKGCLLGLAVGEALGVTNERRHMRAEEFPKFNEGFHTDMRGGGLRQLKAGQVSYASEMAFCLSIAMRNFNGFDVFETANAYARWMPDAPELPEPITLSMAEVLDGRSPEFTGKRMWLEHGQRFKDNGALGRTAPIGVFFATEREERIRASLEDTAITHYAPVCQLASAAINSVISAALLTPSERIEKAELVKVLDNDLALAAQTLGRREPDFVIHAKDAAEWLREDVLAAQDADPLVHGPDLYMFSTPCPVRVTFRLALWELFHAPSFEVALIDVANRGGDAPINCAVTGALLGAMHGDSAIPDRWIESVMESPGPMGGNHWSVYHPQHLITLEPKR